MLVLTRTTGEKITIGDNVCVKVVGVRGGRVKLAIDAPREVPVVREKPHQSFQNTDLRDAIVRRGRTHSP